MAVNKAWISSLYVYTSATTCAYSDASAPCCGGATKIVIDSDVTKIESQVFKGCVHVTAVDMGGAVLLQTIAEDAFNGASALTAIDLTVNTALTSIGNRAFRDCAALATLKLPPAVGDGAGVLNSIGTNAFSGTALTGHTTVSWGSSNSQDYCRAIAADSSSFDFYCLYSFVNAQPRFGLGGSATCDATVYPAGDCHATVDDGVFAACTVALNTTVISAGSVAWWTDLGTLAKGFILGDGSPVTRVCTHA